MTWKCPQCGSKKLSVMICVSADLTQSGDNFETDPNGDHEWGGDSLMTCGNCCHCDSSRYFEDKTMQITEDQALARILRHLAKLGWTPVDLYDGGDDPIPVAGMSVDEVVKECRGTDDCHLRVEKDGNQGTIYLVWGNSPMELVADHSTRWGLDDAVDAALESVWPQYPDDSSEVLPEVQ